MDMNNTISDAIFADLHIHSRFSRACSKDLTIPNLVKWARVKGIGILGTGDFTHNTWLNELKQMRTEGGILYYKPSSSDKSDENSKNADKSENSEKEFPFILTSEISLVYSQGGKGRRVHLLYLAPDFEAVDKINAWLDTKGRRDYDGRPIFKISCRDFVAKMEEIDDKIEVIPAHIWTPYFGVFGSKGGFDNLEEAFLDKRNRIHAIETGISSDPAMNWKIKNLDNISIVSFSDSHSFWPWRLGREATIFRKPSSLSSDNENSKKAGSLFKSNEEIADKSEYKLSYDSIIKQIRENSFIGTVEVDPSYGIYHFSGHMDCNFSASPEEVFKLKGICPVCNRPLTIGVDNRVVDLALQGNSIREEKYKKFYFTILPLHEVISLALGVGMNSKGSWEIYNRLIERFGNEFNILLNVSREELEALTPDKLLVDLIIDNREGKIKVKPGYDGRYGEPILDEKFTREKKLDKKARKIIDTTKIESKNLNDGIFLDSSLIKKNMDVQKKLF